MGRSITEIENLSSLFSIHQTSFQYLSAFSEYFILHVLSMKQALQNIFQNF